MGRKKVVRSPNTLLVETAWEVCNQVGGIYTVVRSKIPEMVRQWDKDFFLLGPYFYENTISDFERVISMIFSASLNMRILRTQRFIKQLKRVEKKDWRFMLDNG